jgi:hypothetical protein
MSEKEYLEYLDEGKKLFNLVGDELNRGSDEFIRVVKIDFRDEKAFKEICLALGLLANMIGLDVDNA